MKLALARTAVAALAFVAVGQSYADIVDVGTVVQIAPKPSITYSGAYGSFLSSSLVQNPVARTVVTLDLHGIMQAAGFSWIERIDVLDAGGNAYFGSPGADLDYWHLEGAGAGTTVTFGYAGPNVTHINESSDSLALRVGALDAISGDQDFNSLHFVSLGLQGVLSATFATEAVPGGSGGSGTPGGGGSQPGEWGGGTPPGGLANLLQVVPGLKLHLSEAGLGEGYAIRIVGASIPAPALLPLLASAPCLVRRGRRRG